MPQDADYSKYHKGTLGALLAGDADSTPTVPTPPGGRQRLKKTPATLPTHYSLPLFRQTVEDGMRGEYQLHYEFELFKHRARTLFTKEECAQRLQSAVAQNGNAVTEVVFYAHPELIDFSKTSIDFIGSLFPKSCDHVAADNISMLTEPQLLHLVEQLKAHQTNFIWEILVNLSPAQLRSDALWNGMHYLKPLTSVL